MKSNKEKLDEIEIISKQRIHKYRPMNPHPMSFFIGFSDGAEWQAEQDNNKFSEEEVLQLIINCKERFGGSDLDDHVEDSTVIKWFEQFKKK